MSPASLDSQGCQLLCPTSSLAGHAKSRSQGLCIAGFGAETYLWYLYIGICVDLCSHPCCKASGELEALKRQLNALNNLEADLDAAEAVLDADQDADRLEARAGEGANQRSAAVGRKEKGFLGSVAYGVVAETALF